MLWGSEELNMIQIWFYCGQSRERESKKGLKTNSQKRKLLCSQRGPWRWLRDGILKDKKMWVWWEARVNFASNQVSNEPQMGACAVRWDDWRWIWILNKFTLARWVDQSTSKHMTEWWEIHQCQKKNVKTSSAQATLKTDEEIYSSLATPFGAAGLE